VLVRPNVPDDGHIRPKHVVSVKMFGVCTTNSVHRNINKTLSYTQYDAEVQHL
jgi:hypothetical protein